MKRYLPLLLAGCTYMADADYSLHDGGWAESATLRVADDAGELYLGATWSRMHHYQEDATYGAGSDFEGVGIIAGAQAKEPIGRISLASSVELGMLTGRADIRYYLLGYGLIGDPSESDHVVWTAAIEIGLQASVGALHVSLLGAYRWRSDAISRDTYCMADYWSDLAAIEAIVRARVSF